MTDRTPQMMYEKWRERQINTPSLEHAFLAGLSTGLLIEVAKSNTPEAKSLFDSVFGPSNQ
jgi:hypothetical protein